MLADESRPNPERAESADVLENICASGGISWATEVYSFGIRKAQPKERRIPAAVKPTKNRRR
jgi:hypothetical protein